MLFHIWGDNFPQFSLTKARENMRNYSQRKLSNGGKMVLLFHIIDESIKHGDKILVFSQSLMTLTLIEKFLSIRKIPDPPDKPADMCQDWIRNVTYFRKYSW